MNKFSASTLEDSGITDPVTGKKIFVTVSARKTFRAANQGSKVRNVLLNTAIANDFARSKPQVKLFRVRGDPNSVGQVRDSANGGRYIAIITSNGVKIVQVAGGVPSLTGMTFSQQPVSPVPAPVKFSSSQSSFFVKHASENLANALNMQCEDIESICELLSERTGVSSDKILRQIAEHDNLPEIKIILKSIVNRDMASDDGVFAPVGPTPTIVHPFRDISTALPSSNMAMSSPIMEP
jgi:hypothetical protein